MRRFSNPEVPDNCWKGKGINDRGLIERIESANLVYMSIDPDFLPASWLIAVGAIIATCRNRNLAVGLRRNTILGRMRLSTCRWIGSALIAIAIFYVFIS